MAFEGISEQTLNFDKKITEKYRFFCASADGSKYSTATRPSIELTTKPIPFGKHLTARV